MKQGSIISNDQFEPRQIVCLEHENIRLYAEVIEVVAARQICWVRPLILATPKTNSDPPLTTLPEDLSLLDLRLGADLLWPTSLFRPALDIEVIPILVRLSESGIQTHNAQEAQSQMSSFVRAIWQTAKSAF